MGTWWEIVEKFSPKPLATAPGVERGPRADIPNQVQDSGEFDLVEKTHRQAPAKISLDLDGPEPSFVGQIPIIRGPADQAPRGSDSAGNSSPACYVHGAEAEWWHRPDGSPVCGRCHPNPNCRELPPEPTTLPPMPPGIRLVKWERKSPPIAIIAAGIVIDVPKFIARTLEQLEARLRGNDFQAGHWSQRELVERLEQVGVKVEVFIKDDQGG